MEEIRVLLVDDDKYIREDIRHLIDWGALGMRLSAEAANGQEALDKLDRCGIDLLITDITMPIMNGIDLIRHAKQRHPYIQALVLSNYDDFSFVKEAMKFGASEYMLKYQLDGDSLQAILVEMCAKIRQLERERGRAETEREREFWRGAIAAGAAREAVEAAAAAYEPLLLRMKIIPIMLWSQVEAEIIREACAEAVDTKSVRIADMGDGCIGLFVVSGNPSLIHMNLQAQGTLTLALSALRGASCIVAMSRRSWGIGELAAAAERLKAARDRYFYEGPATRVFVEEARPERSEAGGALHEGVPEALSARVADALRQRDRERFGESLSAWGETVRRFRLPLRQALKEAEWLRYRIGQLLSGSMPREAEQFYGRLDEMEPPFAALDSMIGIFSEYGQRYCDYLPASRTEAIRPDIEKAIQYIRANYKSQLSLQAVSDHIELSKNHFCLLFKQETGTPFSDYVNRLRIEEAKWLIAESNVKIAEAAERVGFSNYRHFCKLFKKMTGQSPMSYRRKGERP